MFSDGDSEFSFVSDVLCESVWWGRSTSFHLDSRYWCSILAFGPGSVAAAEIMLLNVEQD